MILSNHLKKVPFLLSLLLIASFASAQKSRPVVTGINADPSSPGKITVSWILPSNGEDLVSSFAIYRTAKPVNGFSDIENEKPIAIVDRSSETYTDNVRSSSEYYYTVVTMLHQEDSEKEDGEVLRLVLPGVNTTIEGTKAEETQPKQKTSIKKTDALQKEYEDTLRPIPLPFIDVLDESSIDHEHEISEETKQSIEGLLPDYKKNKTESEPLPVYIFEEDMVSPAGGDEYLLFEILRDYFIKKRYTEAAGALRSFLSQNRTKEVADRASFYLGESYYYTGNFASALTHFLSLEEAFPELARKWTESTLDVFSIEED